MLVGIGKVLKEKRGEERRGIIRAEEEVEEGGRSGESGTQ